MAGQGREGSKCRHWWATLERKAVGSPQGKQSGLPSASNRARPAPALQPMLPAFTKHLNGRAVQRKAHLSAANIPSFPLPSPALLAPSHPSAHLWKDGAQRPAHPVFQADAVQGIQLGGGQGDCGQGADTWAGSAASQAGLRERASKPAAAIDRGSASTNATRCSFNHSPLQAGQWILKQERGNKLLNPRKKGKKQTTKQAPCLLSRCSRRSEAGAVGRQSRWRQPAGW